MGLFGAAKATGRVPASTTTAKNIKRAAKGAKRGGTAIRLPKPTKPRQV